MPSPVPRSRSASIATSCATGGMGVVLAAYDPELDRPVAIKLLRPERTGSRAQARLLREAQAMARLSHPNVVQVYDVGTQDDQVFLTMELVRGRTVTDWLRESKPTWREIVARFVAAGEGLAAAHAVGIVHRDFKPDNVLIADDGRVRVADFGIASYRGDLADVEDAERDPRGFLKAPLTSTGAVVGTPQYMAPEQYAGVDVGPAADQFSFCAALHEALYAQLPFGGDSLAEMAANTIEGRYREPADPGRAPAHVARAVRRGLSLEPAERFADLRELLHALTDEPGRRAKRWAGAIALVGFMIFPLAPPRMVTEYFVDTIEAFGPSGYASREFANYYNAYAAMPSLHFSWTVMFGILFLTTPNKWVKVFGLIYPTMTLLAITITGNHYIMDAVGGGLLVIAAFLTMELGIRRRFFLPKLAPIAVNLLRRGRSHFPAAGAQ